jgi:hypothetical protein
MDLMTNEEREGLERAEGGERVLVLVDKVAHRWQKMAEIGKASPEATVLELSAAIAFPSGGRVLIKSRDELLTLAGLRFDFVVDCDELTDDERRRARALIRKPALAHGETLAHA